MIGPGYHSARRSRLWLPFLTTLLVRHVGVGTHSAIPTAISSTATGNTNTSDLRPSAPSVCRIAVSPAKWRTLAREVPSLSPDESRHHHRGVGTSLAER